MVIAIIILGFILVKAVDSTIKSLMKISRFFELKEFVVAFILMALATSLPDLTVGINAAINKTPILSLGNVIGANIVKLTLILGILVVLGRNIQADRGIVRRDSFFTSMMMVLPLLLLFDKKLSRTDGLVLIIFFFVYLIIFFRQEKKHRAIIKNGFKGLLGFGEVMKSVEIFIIGVAFILLSSFFIVEAAALLALKLKVPLFIIGLFLVALGTSFPELIFGIRALTKRHKKMILGNMMGSVVINVTLVLGITALISPIKVESLTPFLVGIVFTILAPIFFFFFIKTERKLSQAEGVVLIFIYITFVILESFGLSSI